MASLTQWIWVWASSGRWWRTGKPGVLQSVGLTTERLHFHPQGILLCLRILTKTNCIGFLVVQLLGRVRFFVTPWTAAHQASLSITNSQNLFKLMSTASVMPANHLIPCHPLLLLPSIFPSIRVFSNESVLLSGGQSIGASASTSVLPMNIQDWFPLGWTSLNTLQFKGLSRVFSNTTVQKHQFFSA